MRCRHLRRGLYPLCSAASINSAGQRPPLLLCCDDRATKPWGQSLASRPALRSWHFLGKEKGSSSSPREPITFEQIKLRHSLSLIAFKSSVTQYVWFLETMQKIEEGQHGARASSLWRDCASGGLQHKGVMLVHPGTAKALFQPFCLSNPLLGLRAGDREWNANCTGARFIALWWSLANSTRLWTALSPKKQSGFAIKQVFANVTGERDFPL